MRICTIIPFIPEVPPIWIPKDCIMVEDGGERGLTYMKNSAGERVSATIFNNRERQGFGRNVNRAIELAWMQEYDLALIWNSDAKPLSYRDDSAWFEAMKQPFIEHPSIGAVAPVRAMTEAEMDEAPSRVDKAKNNVILSYEPTGQGAAGTLGESGTCVSVHGFGYSPLYMVRIEAFLAVGGHDDLFAGGFYEDADMWIKLRRNGWRTVVNGNCLYEHGGEEGTTQSYRKLYSDEITAGQGARALRLLLTKYGVMPPLNEPLRLSFMDHRRRVPKPNIGEAAEDGAGAVSGLPLNSVSHEEFHGATEGGSKGDLEAPTEVVTEVGKTEVDAGSGRYKFVKRYDSLSKEKQRDIVSAAEDALRATKEGRGEAGNLPGAGWDANGTPIG